MHSKNDKIKKLKVQKLKTVYTVNKITLRLHTWRIEVVKFEAFDKFDNSCFFSLSSTELESHSLKICKSAARLKLRKFFSAIDIK